MSASQRAALLGLPAGLVRTATVAASGTDAYAEELFGTGGGGGHNPGAERRRAKERAASRTLEAMERLKRRGGPGGGDGGGAGRAGVGRFVGER